MGRLLSAGSITLKLLAVASVFTKLVLLIQECWSYLSCRSFRGFDGKIDHFDSAVKVQFTEKAADQSKKA